MDVLRSFSSFCFAHHTRLLYCYTRTLSQLSGSSTRSFATQIATLVGKVHQRKIGFARWKRKIAHRLENAKLKFELSRPESPVSTVRSLRSTGVSGVMSGVSGLTKNRMNSSSRNAEKRSKIARIRGQTVELAGENWRDEGELLKTSDPWKKTTKNSTKRQIQPKANLGYFCGFSKFLKKKFVGVMGENK